MKDSNPGVLIKDFIKKHLKIEEDLQNRINELEAEIKRLKGSSDADDEYILYKEILKILSTGIQITYESDGLYYISMNPISMNNELLELLLVKLKKYRNEETSFGGGQLFDDSFVDMIDKYGVTLNYGPESNITLKPTNVYPIYPPVL